MQKSNFNCVNSINKKKRLITTINKSKIKISNKILILSLIESGNLDKIINEINEDNISTIKSPLVPKGYLSGYEQFISVLDKFISYMTNIIYSPELIETIILNCLENEKLLLSKKYVYDTENIEYYKYNYNYLIGKIFYKNLIKMKNELSRELSTIELNIEVMNTSNKDDMEYLVKIISEIVFVNKNDYKILALFTNITEKKYNLYLNWYKMLLNKYIRNIEFIHTFREFKKKNNSY